MKRKKDRAPRAKDAEVAAAPPAIPSPKGAVIVSAAVIAIVTLMAFAGVFSLDFVAFDDFEAIVSRPEFNPPTAASFQRVWGVGYSELYTPLLWAGWWVLALVGRGQDGSWNAAPFH